MNKEAQLPPTSELLLPEDINRSHFGDFFPEGDIDFEDTKTQENIQGGKWDSRLDFFGQPANPSVLRRAREFSMNTLPKLPELTPFLPYSTANWMKERLTGFHQRLADAKKAELMAQVEGGDWSGVEKEWRAGTLHERGGIMDEFNKMKNQNTEKAVAAGKANVLKGVGGVAAVAAAIGIPALMGLFQNSSASSNAASSNAASNKIDPRVEELRKHVAARQPGAIYRLDDESTSESAAGNQVSGWASSLYERLMQRYKNPKASLYPADSG
jgi:hypothetical protein